MSNQQLYTVGGDGRAPVASRKARHLQGVLLLSGVCLALQLRAQELVDLTSPAGGIITYSSSHATYPGTLAFDNVFTGTASRWLALVSAFPNVYLQYQFNGLGTVVNAYRIYSTSDTSSAPKHFQFKGSYNGMDWVTLDSQTNQTGWISGQPRLYAFWNHTPYTHYRLTVAANNGGTQYVALNEMELFNTVLDDRLAITGFPGAYGAVVPPYGHTNNLVAGNTFLCSAPAGTVNVATGLLARCSGYALYTNGTSLAASGTTNEYLYTHDLAAQLVWHWTGRFLFTITGGANGSISTNGGWFDQGEALVVSATPVGGYRFYCWSGDVPDDDRFSPAITLAASRPRTVAANFGKTYHVAIGGNDTTGDGLSWATAWGSVGHAIATAPDYSQVLISNGTYSAQNLSLAKHLTLQGVGPSETRLDAANAAPIFLSINAAHARLIGLTFYRGSYTAWGKTGSAFILESGVVSNCTIRSCVCNYGAAVKQTGGLITHSRFFSNSGTTYDARTIRMDGGVMRFCEIGTNTAPNTAVVATCDVAGGVMSNCVIRGNLPNGSYSADYSKNSMLLSGNGMAANCLFEGNGNLTATQRGTVRVAGGRLRGCLITGNKAYDEAGIRVTGGTVENCTVAENTISASGDGLGAGLTISGGTAVNTIISGNANTSGYEVDQTGGLVFHSCTDVLISGEGNRLGDPGFTDAANGDFTLSVASMCRNSGTNLFWMPDGIDLAGSPRIIGERVDMGALEAGEDSAGPLTCDFTADREIGFTNLLYVALTAFAGGDGAAEASFAWDLDGDGEYDDASGGTISPAFGPGFHMIGLVATSGESTATKVKTAFIKVYPADVFVSKNGSDTAPYHTWATAARTVVDALSIVRTPGDTRPKSLTISNGTYAARNLLVDVPVIFRSAGPASAILDGENLGRIMTVQHPDALLTGLTFYRGKLDQYGVDGGGLILGNGTISNCLFDACFGGYESMFYQTNGLATHCQFKNSLSRVNPATTVSVNLDGVMQFCEIGPNNRAMLATCEVTGSGVISNCVIHGNLPQDVYNADFRRNTLHLLNGLVSNCRIEGNGSLVNTWGGAVYMAGGTLRGCLIAGNQATNEAGISMSGGAVESCTVAGNTISATGDGKGAGLTISGGTVVNSIFSGNTNTSSNEVDRTGGTITYCCIDDEALTVGTGNRSGAPGFVNAVGGDYTLTRTSQCLNAAMEQAWMIGAVDLAGRPRIRNRVPDVGAFEGLLPGSMVILVR